jgi:uncharacterized membrane protein YdfJ with MMPL/SSD domain
MINTPNPSGTTGQAQFTDPTGAFDVTAPRNLGTTAHTIFFGPRTHGSHMNVTRATVFGLSMDYEVFHLSAVREQYERRGDDPTAVAERLASTARVITAAGLIMVFVSGQLRRLRRPRPQTDRPRSRRRGRD